MASYQPPIETLPIFDNSVFAAVSSTTVLTIAQANLLYLRKTYPDTATALETFQAGILSSSINPLLVSSSLDIGTTQTSNAINIGTNVAKSGTINLGASVSSGNYGVSIGCASGTIKLYSPVQCVSTLEGSGTTLQLGTSNSLTTGVTIGNTGANPIQIGNATSTGTIVIDTASLLNTDGAPAIAIGTSSSVKTIKIGNDTVNQSVHIARLDMTNNGLNNISGATGDFNIGNLQTSGALYLGCRSGGTVRTGGIINIGTDTTTTGIITIGNSTGVHSLSAPCVKLQGDFNYLALNTQTPAIPRSIVAVSSGANTGLYFKSSTVASAGNYDSYILASGGTTGDTSGDLTSNANSFSFISGSTSLGTFNTNGLVMNKPITFSTGSTPTGTTQLGGITSISYNSSIPATFSSNVQLSYGSTTITDNGVYIINCFAIATTATAVITAYGINITVGGSITLSVQSGGSFIGSNQIGQSGNTFTTSFSQQLVCSATYQVTSSTLISCNMNFIFTSGTISTSSSSFRFTITRIG